MANILSGSVIVPVEVIGGIQVDADGALDSNALSASDVASEYSAGKALNAGLSMFSAGGVKNVITALNTLGGTIDGKIGLGNLSADNDLISYDGAGAFSTDATQFTASSHVVWDAKLAAADTDDLSEGSSNLYYTDARVRAAVSAGNGLDFNSGTGEFSVDIHSGGGLEIDQTELAIASGSFAPTWGAVHKFDEPIQLLDQHDPSAGVYYKLKIEDGLLKVESAS